jgi:hypothetical protein
MAFIALVGCSHIKAASPADPLPPKGSSTTPPGFVCAAMCTAIVSGEIFVG